MSFLDEIICVTPTWGEERRELKPPEVPFDTLEPPILPPPLPTSRNGTYAKASEGTQSPTAKTVMKVCRKARGGWVERSTLATACGVGDKSLTIATTALVRHGKLERRRLKHSTIFRVTTAAADPKQP